MRNEFIDTRKAIISILGYFDIFNYPLNRQEIKVFLPIIKTDMELEEGIISLLLEKSIFLIQDFYTLRYDPGLIERRKVGNRKAQEMMKTAGQVGRFLSQFPFIKGLAISGSLSKNYADQKSDIDHFLITTKNRLWIARTLLFFLRKFASLMGEQDKYCLNYFIDEEELQIKEKNIYTAMELVTLANPIGNETYDHFLLANSWARDFFPNHPFLHIRAKRVKENMFKRIVESCLNNTIGDYLDNLLMKITTRIWQFQIKSGRRDSKNQLRVVDFDKHFTKLNPRNFQEVFLSGYESKLLGLFQKMDLQNQIQNLGNKSA